MKAFLYGVGLQFKMDIRSRTMLVTCYLVPLVFFFFMSGIFISVDPTATETLIPSMSVFVVTMSADRRSALSRRGVRRRSQEGV